MATNLKEYLRESISKYLKVIHQKYVAKIDHDIVSENYRVINVDYTIGSNMNALSVDPTIGNGITLTLDTNMTYVIL